MIAFFGPAGSGKSLQGQRLAEKYGWKWLSVGQLLRDQGDAKINEKLKTGELFDDEFVTKLMHDAMVDMDALGAEVILDGYPRNELQAKWMIENGDMGMMRAAIVFEVSKDELWARIAGRGRNDDTQKAVERRWGIYEQNIYSILPLFEDNNVKVTTLDGMGTVDEVTARIETILEDFGVLPAAAGGTMAGRDGREKSYGE